MAVSTEAPQARPSALIGSGSGKTESWRALLCGFAFGVTSPLVGHPLDTIKSKMQAQATYYNTSAFRTLANVYKNEGFLALYRGLLPPLIGSTVFRSVQFTAYGLAYGAARDHPFLMRQIPLLGDMEMRVVAAGVFASTARAITESPLDFIKVRKQTGQGWTAAATPAQALRQPLTELRHLYTGFGLTWARTTGLMTSFFMMVDSLERHFPSVISIPVFGPFIKGGVCATLGWLVVWPFENLKNQLQCNAAGVPPEAGALERARYVLKHRGGVLGLYRGIGPGLTRSLIANGSSMIVFNYCQEAMRRAAAVEAA